jgi:rhamnosyl/mannosyltransferase
LLRKGFDIDVLCANTHNRTVTDELRYKVMRVASLGKLLSTSISPAIIAEVVRRRDAQDIIHVHLPDPMTNFRCFSPSPKED